MSRQILLVEPAYKTKFPPMGLMKISSYHKKLGDSVRFVKGINKNLECEYWDRIYVSTLFTYNWKTTIDAIKYYKALVHGDSSRIIVGGIMSSLMPNEVWKETGVVPIQGVLSSPYMLDSDNPLIVEDMIPDYDLFDESFPDYTLIKDSYFGYVTRGCLNKCKFCGVPILEPEFIDYKNNTLRNYIERIKDTYGEKQHLVFFDNNILGSKKFEQIIHDIIDLGFYKGAKRNNKMRHVDFNQGTDARLMKEKHIDLISQIAIYPLRIAFDYIELKDIYCEKIRLAAKYNIKNISNYVLYNYKDTPKDLWDRLKINIELNDELNLRIYSFPMKYIPINNKDRRYVAEPEWNWYFLRNTQRILNVLKGSVMTNEDFFNRAFGSNYEEFLTILHMPENILMYRGREAKSQEIEWKNKFKALTPHEKKEMLNILNNNTSRRLLKKAVAQIKNQKLYQILEYYLPDKPIDDNLELFDNSH